jgi:predicted nuclease of predicted toxin-antitoxin system
VKILLDENVPRKLVPALRSEGHEVESVHTLRLQGLENGKLFEFARNNFDICFTRDVDLPALFVGPLCQCGSKYCE